MIQLDSTAATKFAVHLEGYEGIGEGELVKNGDFSEIGSDLVQNGDFAEIGSELVTNGDFSAVPLGSELITNGDFAVSGTLTNTSWSLGWRAGDNGLSISDGALNLVNDGSGFVGRAYATNGVDSYNGVLEVGKTYKLTYEVTENIDAATLYYYAGSFVSIAKDVNVHTVEFTATTDFFLLRNGSSNTTIKIDNVSVKEQINLVTNPNFTDTGSEMNIADGSSPEPNHFRFNDYGNNTIAYDGSGVTTITYVDDDRGGLQYFKDSYNLNTPTLTIGKSYKIEITCKINSGTYGIQTGAYIGNHNVSGLSNTDFVTHIIYAYTESLSGNWIRIDNLEAGQVVSINDVSIKELGADWIEEPLDPDSVSFGENGLTIVQSSDLGDNSRAYQSAVTSDDKSYKVTYTIFDSSYTSTNKVQYWNGSSYVDLPEQGAGTHVFYYTREGTQDTWIFNLRATTDAPTDFVTISSIIVQELGEGWTFFAVDATNTISIESGGARVISTGVDISLRQTILEIGKSYKLTCDITETLGALGIANTTTGSGNIEFDEGFNEKYFTAASEQLIIKRILGVDNVLIDNITVQEVGQDWTPYTSGTSTVDFPSTGAELNIDALNSNVGIYQSGIFTLGKSYKIVLSMKATSTFDAEILESSGASTVSTIGTVSLTTSYQTFTLYHLGTGTYDLFIHRLYTETLGASQTISIQSVIIQQLDPNGYWNTNPNWLIEQGQAVSDGTNLGSLNQAGITTLGKTYVAKYDILSYTSGDGFQQRVGSGSAYSDAETSIATHSITQIATGNDYIYISPQNTIGSVSNISVRLKNTGAVTLTLINQLTEKETVVELTPLLSNGRYTEFSYQPTGLIEGMYLIKFTGDSTTYAETLAYITTGTPPLGESEYKEYTTGDDNPDYVYIP